jgi:hypothetical protein
VTFRIIVSLNKICSPVTVPSLISSRSRRWLTHFWMTRSMNFFFYLPKDFYSCYFRVTTLILLLQRRHTSWQPTLCSQGMYNSYLTCNQAPIPFKFFLCWYTVCGFPFSLTLILLYAAWLPFCEFLVPVPKLRKATISFVMSCLGTTRLPLDGVFMKFDVWLFFENPTRKFQISLKSD